MVSGSSNVHIYKLYEQPNTKIQYQSIKNLYQYQKFTKINS